jgi:DNA-binding NtrC family response regulator
MTILLIDDDLYFLESLSMNLNLRGYDTRQYTDPRKAFEEYRHGGYDMVITDLNMPGMNGIELLKAIRAFDPSARVMFITADDTFTHIIDALNNQAYAYFLKPVDMESVAHTLEKAEQETTFMHHH